MTSPLFWIYLFHCPSPYILGWKVHRHTQAHVKWKFFLPISFHSWHCFFFLNSLKERLSAEDHTDADSDWVVALSLLGRIWGECLTIHSPPAVLYLPPQYWGILESLCPSVVVSVCRIMSAQYLLNHLTIFFFKQTWYGGVLSWVDVSCGKIGSLSSMSKSQRGLISSKYDYLCCIFQTVGWFGTKLGLIVQHHKPECLVEKWDYCIHDQGHSEGSKCQWMFVQMIFSLCVRSCLLSISRTAQPFF